MSVAVQHNFDLTPLNTFGIHVSAQHFIRVDDDNDLPQALHLARKHEGERGIFVLGGGSNVLFKRDYAGCVVQINTHGMRELEEDVVEAMAGDNWHAFVLWTIERGYSGLENLSLIPGSVGAAPVQNIGAYGVELKETFHSCDVISRSTREVRRLSNAECAFSYRDSVFKSFVGRDWIIRRVRFKLSRTPVLKLNYGELRSELLSQRIAQPTPLHVSQAVQRIRSRKLPDPVLIGNAGSFFKNPVIPTAQFEELRKQYPLVPFFPDDDGWIKIPAAWLIDECGFKGERRGAAGVHDQHALVLVNHGDATGNEIWALAREIVKAVDEKFAIPLSPEPIVL